MDFDLSLLPPSFETIFFSNHDLQLLQSFRLLALPPELWLKVCEYAVSKYNPISVGRENKIEDQVARVRQPAIARTCRLLRQEALPMYYANNRFEMVHSYGVPCPRKWLDEIGEGWRKVMKEFVIESRCTVDFWKGSFERAGIDAQVEKMETPKVRSLRQSCISKYLVRFGNGAKGSTHPDVTSLRWETHECDE